MIYNPLYLPCGAEASFDYSSGISYRCEACGAVVGSVGQPRDCSEEAAKWEAYKSAGLWRWNYDTGEPEALKVKAKR
jgi:hypothetical protein